MLQPLSESDFNLDVGGIVGFLGGEEAISAMESMPFYKYRKWLGWYNSPGSYTIAKHFGKLPVSRFWDGIYPGANDDPATLLGLDGKRGPKFRGVVSGTALGHTGHVAQAFTQYCRSEVKAEPSLLSKARKEGRRTTTTTNVTIADFLVPRGTPPTTETRLQYDETESPLWSVAIASIPMSMNIACCILCGLSAEWFAFGVILYGILCNGMACYLIGSAEIFLRHPQPSPYSPSGNGILDDRDHFVVCRGTEADINYIVKGKIVVKYSNDEGYNKIGLSAMSLTVQFIAQLFLIPLSGLFGQIMFLSTLAISWIYNAYISSIDKDQLQQRLLVKNLPLKQSTGKRVSKVEMPTRTSAVVFAMLSGLPYSELKVDSSDRYARGILDSLLPKDTEVWEEWRALVLPRVKKLVESDIKSRLITKSPAIPQPDPLEDLFDFKLNEYGETDRDGSLLRDLLDDTQGAYESFYDMFLKTPGHDRVPTFPSRPSNYSPA
ncbi:hypothetical protein EYR40_001113 [Pleurotus pulmonarius]|nr:hypothetical protein EYR36_004844 [Pleurotus pulmonarius]KAF4578731.1 hypothetical protein EYR36_000538 [Pleurotus pulmonarius]KAF4603938.1 hypothetical protein EYR38_004354 [Pleurotus pulmonarius]KAF4608766.1 hypothetical protein EYR40_001113 [Pleurotus pulmonarius]